MKYSQRVARAIATVKGFDPDQKCTNYIPHVTDGIARIPEENGIKPAWQFYWREAMAALSALGLDDLDDEVQE